MNRRTICLAAGAAILVLATGCDKEGKGSSDVPQEVELETRTFTLTGANTEEAANVIDAYVYRDRPGNPGKISADRNLISVRETPDNLDRIARVIADLNAAGAVSGEYLLHFQLVEANGTTETDPRIADIAAELGKVLRFEGYRLLGEAFVTTMGGPIRQTIPVPDRIRTYSIKATLLPGSILTGPGRRVVSPPRELMLDLVIGTDERHPGGSARRGSGTYLSSKVGVRDGQTIIIGNARTPDVWADEDTEDGRIKTQPGAQVILVLRVSQPAREGSDSPGTAASSG